MERDLPSYSLRDLRSTTLYGTTSSPLLVTDYRVITFDNRGVGQSTIPDELYSIQTMADDAIALLDHLGIEKCHVVGQSMGGAIAQTLAATHPERINRLIMYSSFTSLGPIPRFIQETMLSMHREGHDRRLLFEIILPWVFGPSLFEDQEQLDLLRKIFAENPRPQPLHGYERQMEALRAFDSSGFLSKITAPTLILQGDRDLFHLPDEAEVLEKGIPNATVTIMPNTGHNVPPFEANRLAEYITLFLAKDSV